MSEFALQLIQESVSLGVLFVVLLGMYRLANRVLTIFEKGVTQFLTDFERIADGIDLISKNSATRKN